MSEERHRYRIVNGGNLGRYEDGVSVIHKREPGPDDPPLLLTESEAEVYNRGWRRYGHQGLRVQRVHQRPTVEESEEALEASPEDVDNYPTVEDLLAHNARQAALAIGRLVKSEHNVFKLESLISKEESKTRPRKSVIEAATTKLGSWGYVLADDDDGDSG